MKAKLMLDSFGLTVLSAILDKREVEGVDMILGARYLRQQLCLAEKNMSRDRRKGRTFPCTWTFDNSNEAFKQTMRNPEIQAGDVLFIPGEQVIGVAADQPVAVTIERGELYQIDHQFDPAVNVSAPEEGGAGSLSLPVIKGYRSAQALAALLGWDLIHPIEGQGRGVFRVAWTPTDYYPTEAGVISSGGRFLDDTYATERDAARAANTLNDSLSASGRYYVIHPQAE